MQIVIDIDEDVYKRTVFYREFRDLSDCVATIKALEKATPLPEHHGRLIDADEAIKTLKSLGNRDYRREKGTIQEAEKMLSYDGYTPTIIEADKEE